MSISGNVQLIIEIRFTGKIENEVHYYRRMFPIYLSEAVQKQGNKDSGEMEVMSPNLKKCKREECEREGIQGL